LRETGYINMVLWQHVVLCKGTLLRMCLTVGVCSVLRCERLAVLIGCCGSKLCCVRVRC